LARRINSLQQLHEIASTTEAHFERQDAGDLFCLAHELTPIAVEFIPLRLCVTLPGG